MILPSTLKRLANKGLNVYKVTIPAWTMEAGVIDGALPYVNTKYEEQIELFTDLRAAQKRVYENNEQFVKVGGPLSDLSPISAYVAFRKYFQPIPRRFK